MDKYHADLLEFPKGKTYQEGPYLIEVKRMPCGNNNGYITLPRGHSYERLHYDDILVDVHGGLTFSGENASGLSVIGFDTAHYGDYLPNGYSFDQSGHYWTHREVLDECRNVVAQLLRPEAAMKIIYFYRRQKGLQLKKKIEYLKQHLSTINGDDVFGVIAKFF